VVGAGGGGGGSSALLLPQAVRMEDTKPAVARARVRRVRFITVSLGAGMGRRVVDGKRGTSGATKTWKRL
jgi:hypothetical protein